MTIANRTHPDTLIALKNAADAAKDAYEAARDTFVKEWDLGRHEGTEEDVTVTLSQRSSMDFDKLLKDYGITEAQFVEMRTKRDATLEMPVLILPAVQINIRAGELPPKEDNGIAYAKIPLNAL